MSSGWYMAYSTSSSAPHSPHLAGLCSVSSAFAEQEKYLSELLEERNKIRPFVPMLPNCYRLLNQELPVEIIETRLMQACEILEDLLKPVDESQDYCKKQQLRELALINGTLRDEGSQMSGSVSPFNNSLRMKRAKTRG